MSNAKEDLTGRIFGHLKVIKEGPSYGYAKTWLSKCDCGKKDLVKKQWQPLVRNPYISCGCDKNENFDGVKFESIEILKNFKGPETNNKKGFKCKCDCGSIFYAEKNKLWFKSSCGCKNAGKKYDDIKGKKWNKLTAIKEVTEEGGDKKWRFQCDCGNFNELNPYLVVNEKVKSCGCARNEAQEKIIENNAKKFSDILIGRIFGMLKVIKYEGRGKYAGREQHLFNCKCECGGNKIIGHIDLQGENIKSCGCLISDSFKGVGSEPIKKNSDKTGQIFGRLKVIKKANFIKSRSTYWWCECSCGFMCKAVSYLREEGGTRSCGCLQKEANENKKIDVSESSIQKMVELHKAGWSIENIAKNIESTRHIVRSRLINEGYELDKKMEFTDEDCKEIINLYQKGISPKEIGKKFQCSETPIKRVLENNQIEKRPQGYNLLEYEVKFTSEEDKEIESLYKKGLSIEEVAIKIGKTYGPVRRRLIELNIKLRVPSEISNIGERSIKLLRENCPELFGQLDINRNKLRDPSFDPDKLKSTEDTPVFWFCPKEDDHKWEAPILNRYNNFRLNGDKAICVFCPEAGNKRRPSKSYNLKTEFPKIAAQWDYEANKPEIPENFVPGSSERFQWICDANPNHKWVTSIGKRTSGRGCPECNTGYASKTEIYISYELLNFLEHDPKEKIIKVGLNKWDCDIVARNKKLIIEYDGYPWHENELTTFEEKKENSLKSDGWKVLRVRAHPLQAQTSDHLIVSDDYSQKGIKGTVDAILKFLVKKKFLEDSQISRYLKKKNLDNKELADQRILEVNKFKLPRKGVYLDPEKFLNKEMIKNWIDIYYGLNNKYPTQSSKSIPEMGKETWKNIDQSLRLNARGLNLNTTLAGLLLTEYGKRPEHGPLIPKLNIDEIANWMVTFYVENKRWPKLTDKKVINVDFEENWAAINSSLFSGRRGLPANLSIKKLIPLAINAFYIRNKLINIEHPLYVSKKAGFGDLFIDLKNSTIKNKSKSLVITTDQLIILTVLIHNLNKFVSWDTMCMIYPQFNLKKYNKSKYYPMDIFNLLKQSIQDNDPNKQLITSDAEKPIALKFNFEKEP